MGSLKASEVLANFIEGIGVLSEGLKISDVDVELTQRMESEFDSIKEELRKDYPTYPALLELSARHVMHARFLDKKQMVLIEKFMSDAALSYLQSTIPGIEKMISELENLSPQEVEKQAVLIGSNIAGMLGKMVDEDLQELKAVNLNKVKSEARVTAILQGVDGAKARSGRYSPLKAMAIELTGHDRFASANNAATAIAPALLATEDARKVGLSQQRAVGTIAGWLRKAESNGEVSFRTSQ